MKFKMDAFDKFANFVYVFGFIVIVILALAVLVGKALGNEDYEEEKTVVILQDKRVDRGLVRVGAAAIGVKKYIYVLNDNGYEFEKRVDEKNFGWFEKGDRIVMMKEKTNVNLFGFFQREKISYRFFE